MQERPVSDLAEIFDAEALVDEPGGRYNIAPTDEAIVVVERDDRRALTGYRWGLIPHWAPDARIASRTFNARAESITSMPAFRESFRRRRCLVPVDAFYEWRRLDGVRQPYRIFRADGKPLALAGLREALDLAEIDHDLAFAALEDRARAEVRADVAGDAEERDRLVDQLQDLRDLLLLLRDALTG